MAANLLAGEQSPYLLQHAHNPVFWFPWGKDAFDKARRENKSVFLSIGYSTCHWCHVMAHESFEDPDTADILNRHFISIKVDREERPDLDHIYMNAVMAFHGQGGWPLSVFLNPDGQPFYGGTYFPPHAKWGTPGFKDVLRSIHDAWSNNQEGIRNSADELTGILKQMASAGPLLEKPDAGILRRAVEVLQAQYDPRHGGFSDAPKFPMGHTLAFLLAMNSQDPRAGKMAQHTLTVMAERGIHDQLASGFHRYATDNQWQVPHFEKMLYDQALLAMAYVQAFQVSGAPVFADTASLVLDFVLSDMRHPRGGFYCAYDADSGGREGAYYVFTGREIDDLLDPVTAGHFKNYYGVTPLGNVASDPQGEFRGENILFAALPVQPAHADAMGKARQKLLEYRRGRHQLHLDDKVLTDWNGLMIAALSYAGAVLSKPRWIDAARQAADLLLLPAVEGFGPLMHSWHQDGSRITAMLDDYAYGCLGLSYLHEATLEWRYLDAALALAERMRAVFEDRESGGFFMVAPKQGLIIRPMEVYDGAMPSGNSAAAFALMKLFFMTGRQDFSDAAERTMVRFYPAVAKAPQGYTFFLQALRMHFNGPLQVRLRGDLGPSQLVQVQKIVYKCLIPDLVLIRENAPGPLSVSVCRRGVCGIATGDLDQLKGQLS